MTPAMRLALDLTCEVVEHWHGFNIDTRADDELKHLQIAWGIAVHAIRDAPLDESLCPVLAAAVDLRNATESLDLLSATSLREYRALERKLNEATERLLDYRDATR